MKVLFLLRYDDRYLLPRRSATPILADDHDGVLAGLQWFRKIPKIAIETNVSHGLAIDDQCRAWFGAAGNFRQPSMQLRAGNFKRHLLRFSLCEEREFIRLTWRTCLLLGVRRDHVPEIISRIEAANVRARAGNLHVANQFGEHRCRANAKVVRNGVGFGFPFKVNARGLWIFRDDWREIFGLKKFRRRKHVGFLNRSAASNRRTLVRIKFAALRDRKSVV